MNPVIEKGSDLYFLGQYFSVLMAEVQWYELITSWQGRSHRNEE
jgi:hypothetical protein